MVVCYLWCHRHQLVGMHSHSVHSVHNGNTSWEIIMFSRHIIFVASVLEKMSHTAGFFLEENQLYSKRGIITNESIMCENNNKARV